MKARVKARVKAKARARARVKAKAIIPKLTLNIKKQTGLCHKLVASV